MLLGFADGLIFTIQDLDYNLACLSSCDWVIWPEGAIVRFVEELMQVGRFDVGVEIGVYLNICEGGTQGRRFIPTGELHQDFGKLSARYRILRAECAIHIPTDQPVGVQ